MFGVGIGEIAVILLVVFLVSPKDLPKAMRKLAQLGEALSGVKRELADLEREVRDATDYEKKDHEGHEAVITKGTKEEKKVEGEEGMKNEVREG